VWIESACKNVLLNSKGFNQLYTKKILAHKQNKTVIVSSEI